MESPNFIFDRAQKAARECGTKEYCCQAHTHTHHAVGGVECAARRPPPRPAALLYFTIASGPNFRIFLSDLGLSRRAAMSPRRAARVEPAIAKPLSSVLYRNAKQQCALRRSLPYLRSPKLPVPRLRWGFQRRIHHAEIIRGRPPRIRRRSHACTRTPHRFPKGAKHTRARWRERTTGCSQGTQVDWRRPPVSKSSARRT
jgi:hypothetical protein